MSNRDELAWAIARHFDHIFGKPETKKPLRHDYLLADTLLAAGWVKGREQWGVSTRGSHYWINPASTYTDPAEAEALAEKWREHSVEARVMKRTVTDWEEVR